MTAKPDTATEPERYVAPKMLSAVPTNRVAVEAVENEGRLPAPLRFRDFAAGTVLTVGENFPDDREVIDRLVSVGAIETPEAQEARDTHAAKVADLDSQRAKLEQSERDRLAQDSARRAYEAARAQVGHTG